MAHKHPHLFPSTPNLDVLLGRDVVTQMLTATGGLQGLVILNGMRIRLLGIEEKKAEAAASKEGSGSVAGSSSTSLLAKEAEKVIGGYIIESALLATIFDEDVAGAIESEPLVVRKAVDVLGNKCALAAKADLAGTRRDGGYGKELAAEIRAAVEIAKEKGKVDAGHVKALSAVETREDRKKARGGKQARSNDKRLRTEAEDGFDAVTIVLEQFMGQVSEADIGLTREEREEKLMRRDDVRRAILVKQEQMKRDKERREQHLKQRNDLASGAGSSVSAVGADEHLFARSSGYLEATFGACRASYEGEGAMYAHMAAVLR